MSYASIFKFNPHHDDHGRFASADEGVLPGHAAHPTVDVMKSAITKIGYQAFEDAVTKHISAMAAMPEGEAMAHEVERVARTVVGLIDKDDDYNAADPSPAPDVTTQDLQEKGGFKITQPRPKKRKPWLQRVKDAFKRVPPDAAVQSTAMKGLSHVFDKHGK